MQVVSILQKEKKFVVQIIAETNNKPGLNPYSSQMTDLTN